MAYQVDKLEKVGLEGFALVDEFYGRKQVDRLAKVGLEGFALLDEVVGRKKKHQICNRNNQHKLLNRGPQVITVKEPVIDSNQTVQFYGGKVMDRRM